MDPSLYSALNEATIRLNVTCGLLAKSSCVEFIANFTEASSFDYTFIANFTEATSYTYTNLYEFEDECFHGFSNGAPVPIFEVPEASSAGPARSASLAPRSTLILAGQADQGLPWSEGFYVNGSQKDDEFWGDWWAFVSLFNSTENRNDEISSSGGGCLLYPKNCFIPQLLAGNFLTWWHLRPCQRAACYGRVTVPLLTNTVRDLIAMQSVLRRRTFPSGTFSRNNRAEE